MNRKKFETTIIENWASYFNCPAETTLHPGTTLLPEGKYDGERVIALWYIGQHTFVQLDPACFDRLDALVKTLPSQAALTGEHIQAAYGERSILSRDMGWTHYLFPPDLPDYLPPSPFTCASSPKRMQTSCLRCTRPTRPRMWMKAMWK